MEEKYGVQNHTDKNGYTYETVDNDINKVRIYTLKNGLQVFLAQNFDAPKIQTFIPVKTGSNRDPKDNTGLAHYLEHMMFKGTTKLGTTNWELEKEILEQISNLFEKHKAESDPEKKKEIYKEIDRLSYEASTYAIANEYDKAISSLGATGTNAHTWLDETVYKNTIPSNELEKWLKIESNRFSELVLRLFHTELESVYEEFNRAQDNDARLTNQAMMELLFPTHPNGQQTTLGKPEHLKNPSMKAIHEYFNAYYVPNNFAMVLVGDLEFDSTIQLIDYYFGSFEPREIIEKEQVVEAPMTKVVTKTIKSPTIPRVQIAWRTYSYGTRECILADICAHILSNKGEAGLLDLNINQEQKALVAKAYSIGFKQYGYISILVVPKKEDTLDHGIELILNEIEHLKKGEFPDWLLPAIMKDLKFQRLKALETANGLASSLYDVYIKGRTWQEELKELDIYEQTTKKEIVAFAKAFFQDNYAVVYKERGKNENLIRVDSPKITPIQINREAQSAFLKEILNERTEPIAPEFIDYDKEIETDFILDRKFSFIRNTENEIAECDFIFPMGKDHDKELVLAVSWLDYLGTTKYEPREIKEKFYEIGVNVEIKTSQDKIILSLAGLEENILSGVDLLFHWIENVEPKQDVYDEFVQSILESRAAAQKDKQRIMSGLISYAKFGENSRFREIIPEEELKDMDIAYLAQKMKSLFHYPLEVFFYGKNKADVQNVLSQKLPPITLEIPKPQIFPESSTDNTVYFYNYDMVQVEMSRAGKGAEVNIHHFGKISVFNEYFGSGLSSIVFQEMRESKSLAYSAYVSYQTNAELNHSDYVLTYIGTQPDKLVIAVDTLDELMHELPHSQSQFENAKNSALKKIETSRIRRTAIFYNYLQLQKLGITYDYRKDIYKEIQQLNFETLNEFNADSIQSLSYNTAILGKKDNLNTKALEKFGTLKELGLKDIFGY